MAIPVRSIRLEKRSSKSLDTLSGSAGEIFFDADRNTLRIYTANQADSIVLADRTWVTENTFSGSYNDLTDLPPAPSWTDILNKPSFANVSFSGDYNDLINTPTINGGADITQSSIGDLLDVTLTTPALGQVLQYDGNGWVNAAVAGITDTNTTYTIGTTTISGGVSVDLTDSDAVTESVQLKSGTGISLAVTNTNEITITNNATLAINGLTDVTISNPQDGQILQYNSGIWLNAAAASGGGGIDLTDLSVQTNTASGGGALTYDSNTGQFSFTPAVPGASLSSFSVTTSAASAGGSLTYNNTSGVFTFRPADLSGLNTDLVNDLTPQLGGDLDLNASDITGTGNINITGAATFTGTVTANDFVSSATGAPTITSASTITLTAPDGLVISDSTDTLGTISIEKIDSSSLGAYLEITAPYGNTFTEGLKITGAGSSLTFDVSSNQLGGGMLVTDGVLGLKAPAGIVMNGPVSEPTGTTQLALGAMTFDVSDRSIRELINSTISADYTVAFTNVPSTTNQAQTYVLVIGLPTNGFNPNTITINGTGATLLWQGGSAPSTFGTVNIYSFTILSTSGSSPFVLGSMTSYS